MATNQLLSTFHQVASAMTVSDEKLMDLVHDHAPAPDAYAPYHELWGRHYQNTWRICNANVPKRHLADEANQLTWLNIWKTKSWRNAAGRFKPWAGTIARNAAKDACARDSRLLPPHPPHPPKSNPPNTHYIDFADVLVVQLGTRKENEQEVIMRYFYPTVLSDSDLETQLRTLIGAAGSPSPRLAETMYWDFDGSYPPRTGGLPTFGAVATATKESRATVTAVCIAYRQSVEESL